jgi:hypothetical protein
MCKGAIKTLAISITFRLPVVWTQTDEEILGKSKADMDFLISGFQQSVPYGKNAKACPFNRGNRAIAPRHSPLPKSKPTTSSRATQ